MVAALALLVALPGCLGDSDGATSTSGSSASVELVERDVEAPEVFHVTATGLWDGRPSLGGVWVAHPDVSEPERVIIRNEDNGKFVIGALFRRERDNPGPALQVSSDAAQTLGMLAGAPANLNVTALRREEAAQPAPTEDSAPEALPDSAEGATLAPGAISTQTLDGAAPAAAPATPPAAAAAPAAAPATAPATSTLERPFIQLGIFSVEANANGLAAQMTGRGVPARVARSTVQGQPYWRVLVGPAESAAQRATWLEQVKAQGFADAYFVRN
ncbi:MAG: SPOR domain-containing protein [Rubellimicrobium sp.]|nr:SPOR domain-containing protein [Rubellimicrobium sp.]